MARRLLFGCVMLLCGAIASCSDATAPSGTLLMVVSPDTVHFGLGIVPPYVTYRERIVSVARTKVWIAPPDVETELSPGQWSGSTDPNNQYLQAALGNPSVWSAVTNADLVGVRSIFVRLVAGRYRVRQQFRVSAPDATQATGEVFVATSNPFVVAP